MRKLAVSQSVLSCLAAVAQSALEDLNSGLDDGTYEDAEIAGWEVEAIEAALNDAEEALQRAAS